MDTSHIKLFHLAKSVSYLAIYFALFPLFIGANVAHLQDTLVMFNKQHDILQCYICTVYVRHNVENLNNRLFRQSFGLASCLYYMCHVFRSIKAQGGTTGSTAFDNMTRVCTLILQLFQYKIYTKSFLNIHDKSVKYW